MSERRKDCGCSKVTFSILPQNVSKMEENRKKNSPKWAKVARKLRSVAKIARLHENAKVAQKLRCATSQFSGGTVLRIFTAIFVDIYTSLIWKKMWVGVFFWTKCRSFQIVLHWYYSVWETKFASTTLYSCGWKILILWLSDWIVNATDDDYPYQCQALQILDTRKS